MPAPARNHLLLFRSSFYRYLLGPFRFATDVAAPLPSPYTEGGAVGSLTLSGAARQSTTGGELVLTGDGVSYLNSQLLASASIVRQSGLALFVRTRPVVNLFRTKVGWADSAGSTTSGFNRQSNTYSAGSFAAVIASPGGVNEDLCVVLRSAGAFYLYKLASAALWTLVAVDLADAASPRYPVISQFDTGAGAYDNAAALNLGLYDSRFATDEGPATDRKATSSAGDTITMRADAWVEHTLTAATGVDKDFYVRWTDDNNCWIVRQNQAGSTVKLVEKVAGVETSRLSVAQTFTNAIAYRLIAICDGSSITVWVNTTKAGTYASATTNQTATTAKAPAAGVELKSYPRFVTLPSGI